MDLTYQLYCGCNSQALAQLKVMKAAFQLVYLDPPYNTGRLRGARREFRDVAGTNWSGDMLRSLTSCRDLLLQTGFLAASINQTELFHLKSLADQVFGSACFVGLFPVKIRHDQRQLMINATFHDLYEYLLIYRKSRTTRFFTEHKAASLDKFLYSITTAGAPAEMRTLGGKTVEIYEPGQYEIQRRQYSEDSLRRYIIAGKLATANWSGEWFVANLHPLGPNLLVKVYGLEKEGLGYRWFQTQSARRRSGVYFQSQRTAGRPVLPSNDLDFTDIMPTIYREGGPGCDFKDSKKPEALLDFLLRICTKPGDMVLDPFAGSGTTLSAAVKAERSATLIENNPVAIEIIKTRAVNLADGNDIDCLRHSFALDICDCRPDGQG